jgi:hypothetical protein
MFTFVEIVPVQSFVSDILNAMALTREWTRELRKKNIATSVSARFGNLVIDQVLDGFHEGAFNQTQKIAADIASSKFEECVVGNLYQLSDRPKLTSRFSYNTKKFDVDKMLSEIQVNNQGPLTLQGIFWLNISASARLQELISFAPTREGGDLGGAGSLPEYAYRLRTMGENYAIAGYPSITPLAIKLIDATITLNLVQGSIDEPDKFEVYVDISVLPLACDRFMALEQCHGDGILDYTMELQNTPASINDGKNAHEKYTNSVVWFRKSRTALVSYDYEFIQIVDGNGAILQPAYDDWLATADALGLRTYITSHLKKKTVPAWCLDYF